MPQGARHVVITPAFNEEAHLPGLIASMTRQSVPPEEWIIVDDGSTDGTPAVVEQAGADHPWIRRLRSAETGRREVGGKVARLFLHGLSLATQKSWQFVSKIDADLTLPDDYFAQVLARFAADPQLGIAGGTCWVRRGSRLVLERAAADHTRGALKTYRRDCWESIGGVRPVDGWDGIDNAMAQMRGWRTQNFADIRAIHHRSTGSFRGVLRGRYTTGRFAAFMGYHPLFMIARTLRRMLDSPLVVGGVAMGAGYLFHRLRGEPVFEEREVVEFLRGRQLARMGFRRRWPQ